MLAQVVLKLAHITAKVGSEVGTLLQLPNLFDSFQLVRELGWLHNLDINLLYVDQGDNSSVLVLTNLIFSLPT